MSYKASNNSKKISVSSTSKQTPFCKVCYDAKRPGYDTHYLKDFKGPVPVVVCPYLLELKCNYCKNSGHTVSYCDILKAKKATEEAERLPSQNGRFFILHESSKGGGLSQKPMTATTMTSLSKTKQTRPPRANVGNTANQFEALFVEEEDSAEEEQQEIVSQKKAVRFVEEVPLSSSVCEEKQELTWAKIVAKSPTVPRPQQLRKGDVIMTTATATPALYERPVPKFIIHEAVAPVAAAEKKKTIDDYFFKPPSSKAWWDDSSDDDDM